MEGFIKIIANREHLYQLNISGIFSVAITIKQTHNVRKGTEKHTKFYLIWKVKTLKTFYFYLENPDIIRKIKHKKLLNFTETKYKSLIKRIS